MGIFNRRVELACPCGKPMSLAQQADGDWVLGDLDTPCSPIVKCSELAGLLSAFIELAEKRCLSEA